MIVLFLTSKKSNLDYHTFSELYAIIYDYLKSFGPVIKREPVKKVICLGPIQTWA